MGKCLWCLNAQLYGMDRVMRQLQMRDVLSAGRAINARFQTTIQKERAKTLALQVESLKAQLATSQARAEALGRDLVLATDLLQDWGSGPQSLTEAPVVPTLPPIGLPPPPPPRIDGPFAPPPQDPGRGLRPCHRRRSPPRREPYHLRPLPNRQLPHPHAGVIVVPVDPLPTRVGSPSVLQYDGSSGCQCR